MISQKISQLVNEQVGHEFAAFIQYVAVSAYFESLALPKLARYFAKQAEEEKVHALKFIKFLNDTDQAVAIPPIPQPACAFKSVEDAIQLAYEQEVRVTKQIEAIYNQAASESDRITQNFLQWFLAEQLEEVSSMDTLLKITRRAGDNLFRIEDYVAREGHPEEAIAG
ncbi:MAG TPA: ferritin [Verrucomicrobiae bacterium]|mgnify:CR=1 FL=1|nr:ferritin [Verrucomicrobiae bacterium]